MGWLEDRWEDVEDFGEDALRVGAAVVTLGASEMYLAQRDMAKAARQQNRIARRRESIGNQRSRIAAIRSARAAAASVNNMAANSGVTGSAVSGALAGQQTALASAIQQQNVDNQLGMASLRAQSDANKAQNRFQMAQAFFDTSLKAGQMIAGGA